MKAARIFSVAVILAALSAFVYGYEYGINPNHIQILPFIAKIKDVSLFPGDYFVNTLNHFPSIYPYVMAWLSGFVGLEALHLILYFIFKFALLLFAYGLANFLFRSGKTAIITMFLFAFSPLINAYGLLGHDPLMKTSFYQTSAVAPFAVAAMLTFLRRRYIITACILALIYYINALIGNFLFILFSVATAYKYFHETNKFDLRKTLYSLILFTSLMIPGLAWLVRLNVTNPARGSLNFVLFLKLWYTGHYFPSFFTVYQWYHFAVTCIFFIIFFSKGFGNCREKKVVRVFIFTLVAMWLAAAVFGEILPVRSLILFQLLRSDVLFIVLGIIFAAEYIRSFLDGRSIRDMAVAGLVILALIEFSEPSYAEFVLIVLLFTEYKARIEGFLSKITKDPARSFSFLWNLLVIFLVTFSAVSLFICKASPKMGCMLVFSIMLALDGHEVKACLKSVVTALVLFVALFSYVHIFEYRITSMNFSNIFEERYTDWKKLQLWARENTPPGAMFIAPLDMNGFRVFSNRPVFVDWVDGAAMHWSPGFEELWVDRLKYLGITGPLIKSSAGLLCGLGTSDIRKLIHRFIYDKITEDEFMDIRNKYGAEYVIESITRPLSFKQVYENSTFRVYRIE